MLAGDRLYIDVYDNKDPLFYYLLASEALAGPLIQYLAETVLIIGTGYFVAITARRFQPKMSALVFTACWLAAAYIFTGWFWSPGMPGTPGTFLAQTAITAIIFDLPVAAGAALAATLFTNLIFFPPATWFVLVFCLLRSEGKQRVARKLAIVATSGAAVASVIALLLLLRGEWSAYFAMLTRNVQYTQENWQRTGGIVDSGRNHLAATIYFGKAALPVWVLSAVLLVLCAMRSPRGSAYRSACLAGASLFPMLLLESAGVAFLEQHLAPWRLLVFLSLSLVVPQLLTFRRQWLVIPLLALAMLTLLPLTGESKPIQNPLNFATRLRQLGELSPETRLLSTMAGDSPVSYARLGTNNDFHHALGTEHYRLVCPDFQQYDIYSVERLSSIVRCALSADYIIVDLPPDQLRKDDVWLPPYSRIEELNARWRAYRQLVDRATSRGYTCFRQNSDLRLCHKRT
jgi:hypothetical protein